ncbi:MAG: phosphoserine phosphatase SerB [Rubrivivax sp.]|nr:phosphoserine phosphatase SerB [Rubrivivax sp.]
MTSEPTSAATPSAAQEIAPGLMLRGAPPPPLRQFGLVAFDMDSTLISIECIDEIAAVAGRKAEVAAITEAAMRGEIADYAESLARRLALLRGVPAEALEAVYTQRLALNPGVEAFVAACREAGLKTVLVSGGFTFFADRVKARLQLDFARANVLEIEDGRLSGRLVPRPWGTVVDGAEKRRVLLELAELLGLQPEATIAVGDGANDLPMMGAAGCSIAFHAKPAVREKARVSVERGGLDLALRAFGR